MSRIRSTPRMIAIPSGGTPTVASTTMRSGSEPPGTPAAPTAVITLSTSTTTCVPRLSETPNTWARKSTVTPSYRAVPFMHMVEPSGSTKPAILGRSEEHTSELQSRLHLVCRLLLEKKKKNKLQGAPTTLRDYVEHVAVDTLAPQCA